MRRRDFITAIAGTRCRLAARRARAARRADAAHRRAHGLGRGRSGGSGPHARRSAGVAQLGETEGRNLRIDHAGPRRQSGRYSSTRHGTRRTWAGGYPGGTGAVTWAALHRQPAACLSCSRLSSMPFGAGFVASLARPGGNATGFTVFEYGMSGKWLELLKDVAPRVTRAAVLGTQPSPRGSGSSAPFRPRHRRWR